MIVILLFILYGIFAAAPDKLYRVIKGGSEPSDKVLVPIRISGVIALIIAIWFIKAFI